MAPSEAEADAPVVVGAGAGVEDEEEPCDSLAVAADGVVSLDT